MAVSISTVLGPELPRFRTVTDVTFDSSYLEGGESLTAAQLGLASVQRAECYMKNGDEAKEAELFVGNPFYDPEKAVLKLYNLKTGKEVATTKNMEKVVVRVVAHGTTRAL